MVRERALLASIQLHLAAQCTLPFQVLRVCVRVRVHRPSAVRCGCPASSPLFLFTILVASSGRWVQLPEARGARAGRVLRPGVHTRNHSVRGGAAFITDASVSVGLPSVSDAARVATSGGCPPQAPHALGLPLAVGRGAVLGAHGSPCVSVWVSCSLTVIAVP